MEKLCLVCDYPFKDGERVVAVMLSTYKKLDSDIHYAITPPTQCLEIVHVECYDGPTPDAVQIEGGN